MKAYIKKERFDEFKRDYLDYGFTLAAKPEKGWVKVIDPDGLYVIVMRRTREVKLLAGMGGSPFMEVHKDKYQDLVDKDFIEYKKGRYD
jgi:hypothetical protein